MVMAAEEGRCPTSNLQLYSHGRCWGSILQRQALGPRLNQGYPLPPHSNARSAIRPWLNQGVSPGQATTLHQCPRFPVHLPWAG